MSKQLCVVPAGNAPYQLRSIYRQDVLAWAEQCKDYYDSRSATHTISTDGLYWWSGCNKQVLAVLVDMYGPRIPIRDTNEEVEQ